MNLLPLILKKRDQQELSRNEIRDFVFSLTSKKRPADYQVASLLAFILARGMSEQETLELTTAMKESGKPLEYKKGFPREAFYVDKHSTGGVGDKITLPLLPLVASAADHVFFPTIAGRALGHTGGTVDKLESIPGFSCAISREKFYRILKQHRGCFLSQTKDIAPADRELYHLRDVTGTVASIPLITASILSKKLSESLNFLLLDLKTGSGSFLPNRTENKNLGLSLLRVLRLSETPAEVWMTNMDSPLGRFSGNRLEVLESLQILKGDGPKTTSDLTKHFARRLLIASGLSEAEANHRMEHAIQSGAALETFEKICRAQGGKVQELEKSIKRARLKTKTLKANQRGFLKINATQAGLALCELGAGRIRKSDKIDPNVGFEHSLEHGDQVEKGQEILKLHYNSSSKLERALRILNEAYQVSEEPLKTEPLLIENLSERP
jgi:pyrimidine-nucleoside phosphorylase